MVCSPETQKEDIIQIQIEEHITKCPTSTHQNWQGHETEGKNRNLHRTKEAKETGWLNGPNGMWYPGRDSWVEKEC